MELLPVNPNKIVDISGQRFGLLTVVEPAGVRRYKTGMAVYFRCRCDCGNETLAQRSNLRRATVSCGCTNLSRGTVGKAGTKHVLYVVWRKMLERCYSESSPDYENYGGRGIAVCERWRTGSGDDGGLDCFIADMGERPSGGFSLERRDNNKGYEPDNCRWANRSEQGRNKRNNVLLTFDGRTQPLSTWCEELSLPYFTTRRRLGLGWSVERAFTEPTHDRGQPR